MSQSNDTKHAANAEEILKKAHFETDDGNTIQRMR